MKKERMKEGRDKGKILRPQYRYIPERCELVPLNKAIKKVIAEAFNQ